MALAMGNTNRVGDSRPPPLKRWATHQRWATQTALMMVFICAPALAADSGASPGTTIATSHPAATLHEAHNLYMEGYYALAVEQYEMLAADPRKKLNATLGIVRCHLMCGDYAQAGQHLTGVEKAGKRSADWFALAAELEAGCGQYEQAIQHARRAVRLNKAHYRARYLLGQLLETVGRRAEAVEAYRWFDALLNRRFPPTAEAATETARGFHRYSLLTTNPNINDRTTYVLHDLLQVAYIRMDRKCWPARIAAADLLCSKFNLEEAGEDYKAALQINNNLPAAYVGLGRIALATWDFEETERRVALALQVNPRHVPALNLRAEQKITERRYAQAAAACKQALAINPNDLRALSLAAGAAICMGDRQTSKAMQARVEKINPQPALLHAIMGDVLAGLRQYGDSQAHYLRAIEYDPTDANIRCELGMMYMQWGYESKARAALDAAWALDEFNARTRNTLELLESLEAFATCETEHFIIRYDAEREAVLPHYMAGFLEGIYDEICTDYATYPAVKTIIEVFPTAGDFGVRITGKPWIFTVGACTGRVIALSSPRNDPQLIGCYNWAGVLRHEFTHTVTLAATNNRIPHWYTEGLAVSEEESPRSFAWRVLLADRVRRDELFTLESIDWGFMRPRRRGDRQAAYAQSEWMCEYLVGRFGYDVLNRMLVDYRDGFTQQQVFPRQTGISPEQFDTDFNEWARGQVAGWGFPLDPPESVIKLRGLALLQPNDAGVLGRLAKAQLDDDNYGKALAAARKALGIDENEKTALQVCVEALAHQARKQTDAERKTTEDEMLPLLRRLVVIDPSGWTAPKLLAQILLRREQYDQAQSCLEQLQRDCPLDPFSYSGLACIHLDRDQPELALPQLLELARLDEHDADTPARIAGIYTSQGKLSQARHWFRQALYVDPFRPATHVGFARVLMRQGDTKAALEEYQVLCRLQPTVAQHFTDTALAFQKIGDTTQARDYARRAIKLDPTSPAGMLAE